MDFKDIIGHEKIIQTLKNSIEKDTISHAYLFQGEEGIGKKKLSYAFSKALLCLDPEVKPCNTCSACKRFDSGSNPDFFHIEAEKGLIKVKAIEDIQSQMNTAPLNSNKKVVLIEEAHLMNLTSTNKLLKTLEEPPRFVHIILTSSNPFKLLTTILSRVQIINFFPVPKDQVESLLISDYGMDKSRAKFITEFTKGAIGKSIDLSQGESLFQRREDILKILDAIILGDKTKVFYSMDFFQENEEDVDEILDMIVFYFRDLLFYKRMGDTPLIINRDKLNLLSSHSFMHFNKINDIILNIMETKDIIKKNINYKLAIEAMLLNI